MARSRALTLPYTGEEHQAIIDRVEMVGTTYLIPEQVRQIPVDQLERYNRWNPQQPLPPSTTSTDPLAQAIAAPVSSGSGLTGTSALPLRSRSSVISPPYPSSENVGAVRYGSPPQEGEGLYVMDPRPRLPRGQPIARNPGTNVLEEESWNPASAEQQYSWGPGEGQGEEGRPPQPLHRGLEQADGTVTYTGAAYEGYRTEQPVERIAQVLKDQLQTMVAKAVAASITPSDTTVGVAPPGASSSLGPAGLMTTKEVDKDLSLIHISEPTRPY